jgi:hypothetical protein
LKIHQSEIENVFEKNTEKYAEVHIAGVLNKEESKRTKNKFFINLDVFDNTKEEVNPSSTKHVVLRSLLKYKPLLLE